MGINIRRHAELHRVRRARAHSSYRLPWKPDANSVPIVAAGFFPPLLAQATAGASCEAGLMRCSPSARASLCTCSPAARRSRTVVPRFVRVDTHRADDDDCDDRPRQLEAPRARDMRSSAAQGGGSGIAAQQLSKGRSRAQRCRERAFMGRREISDVGAAGGCHLHAPWRQNGERPPHSPKPRSRGAVL